MKNILTVIVTLLILISGASLFNNGHVYSAFSLYFISILIFLYLLKSKPNA